VHNSRAKCHMLSSQDAPRKRRWTAEEREEMLFSRYPLFFRAVHYPEGYPSHIALFGIQCGTGWYPIIEEVASEVEQEIHTLWCDTALNAISVATIDTVLLRRPHSGVYPLIPFCSDIRQIDGALVIVLVDGYPSRLGMNKETPRMRLRQ